MAILHNNAGQHGKGEADRRFDRWLTTALLMMAALGFVAGAFIGRGMGYVGFAIFLATLGAMWLSIQKIARIMDGWSRERIKYLRGAQAEALVAWRFKALEDDWHVFNNLQLEEASDIDHVLVGPGGVWCVSTKSHRGLLTVSERGELLYNLKAVNWLGATKAQAMRLRDRLAALLGRDVPYVTPMLAVPFAYVDLRTPWQHVHVAHEGDLLRPISEAPQKLSNADVQRIADILGMLAKSAKTHYRRPEISAAAPAPKVPAAPTPALRAAIGRGPENPESS